MKRIMFLLVFLMCSSFAASAYATGSSTNSNNKDTYVPTTPATPTATPAPSSAPKSTTKPATSRISLRSVEGLNITEEEGKLKKEGFTVKITYEFHDSVPANNIISQNPAKGSYAKGTAVNLVVSKGRLTIMVPDIKGITVAEAVKKLQDAGFEIGTENSVESQNVKKGRIVEQSPKSSDMVPKGTKINVDVSYGRDVSVPKLLGLTLAEAKKILSDAGLGINVIANIDSKAFKDTLVIAQVEFAGTVLKEDSIVDVVINIRDSKKAAVISGQHITVRIPIDKKTITSKVGNKSETNIKISEAAYIKNDTTMLPIADIGEALGIPIENIVFKDNWAMVIVNNNVMQFQENSEKIYINNELHSTMVNPKGVAITATIKNDTFFLPLRTLGDEVFNVVSMDWDNATQTVTLVKTLSNY